MGEHKQDLISAAGEGAQNSRCDIKLQMFKHWVVISYFTSLGCLDRVVDNPVYY